MKYIFISLLLLSCNSKHCETLKEYKVRVHISSNYRKPQIDSLQNLINESVEKQKKLSDLDWIDEALIEVSLRNKQLKYMIDETDSISNTKSIPCQ